MILCKLNVKPADMFLEEIDLVIVEDAHELSRTADFDPRLT